MTTRDAIRSRLRELSLQAGDVIDRLPRKGNGEPLIEHGHLVKYLQNGCDLPSVKVDAIADVLGLAWSSLSNLDHHPIQFCR